MNNEMVKVEDCGETWVTCPACGKPVMKAAYALADEPCEHCDKMVTAFAMKNFALAIAHDKSDKLPIVKRVRLYVRKIADMAC
ncbi:hypothetical protein [Butyrivibrio sp.]|uniref:hypothetical protein n=1 Tax=Butyrivibrio sp. TaxID=28121 RepID=UPI0025BDA570|nr:hypothetical protein [Butyrivibrio sp.]MBQ9305023.1 hypothetical protein [Butyrivibrio sp.]